MSRGILKHIAVMAACSLVGAIVGVAADADDYGAPVVTAPSTGSSVSTSSDSQSHGAPVLRVQPTSSDSSSGTYGAPVSRTQSAAGGSGAAYGAPVVRAQAVNHSATAYGAPVVQSAPASSTTSYGAPVARQQSSRAITSTNRYTAPLTLAEDPSVSDQRQQHLEATDGATCPDCQKDAAAVLQEQIDRYARIKERTWSGNAIAKVMGALYQRCDADTIFVTPDYYSKALHNADERVNRFHGYEGGASKEAFDMSSGNDEPTGPYEWISYQVASQSNGLIYNQSSYAPGCIDMRVNPVAFRERSPKDDPSIGRSLSGHTADGQMTINMHNGNPPQPGADAKNFTTTDCSNFVRVVLATEGYCVLKNCKSTSDFTTTTLLSLTHPNANSCIQPAKISARESMKSGDIIVFNEHHSMVVDRVGEDPFGLSKMKPGQSCQDLDPKNFDIDLVQSGLFGGRLGPEHVRFKDLLADGSMIQERQNALWSFALGACEAKRSGTSFTATGQGATLLRPAGLSDPQCYIHKPMTHPDCVADPNGADCKSPWGAKLKGEECLANCTLGGGGSAP